MFYYILDIKNRVISKHKTVKAQTVAFSKLPLIIRQRGAKMADSNENLKKGDFLHTN